MINYLSAESVSKAFGEKVLFNNIFFGVNKGQKVALIAKNGAGKTTLLNILAGKDSADAGIVTYRKGISVGYLDQDPTFNTQVTVLETIFYADSPESAAIREYERLLELSENNMAYEKDLQLAFEKIEALHAWEFEARAKEILSKLRVERLGQTIATLSGGQKKRVALARILVNEPDLLILDEPTNHLDLDMIEWLEKYLSSSALSALIVTHDRSFLDNVTSDIYELEDGKLYHYAGNYEYFIEKKAEREFIEKQELSKAQNLYRRELEWMRTQPKARRTKAKAREDSFYELEEKARPKNISSELKLDVKMNRIGGKIVEVKNVSKKFEDIIILKNFSYVFKPGDRIGIVGKNGVGKSTFLNMLIGLETPESGTFVMGETIVPGYYKQEGLVFDENEKVIDIVKKYAEVIQLKTGEKITASQFLTHFMFPPPVQHNFVFKLSGGEKRRLHLLTVLIQNPNFLILDEPTNDLDLMALQVLEEFLENFAGCLIIVSHDRYFMDKLVNHLFVFEGNGIVTDFNGKYSEFRDMQLAKDALQAQEEKKNVQKEFQVLKEKKKANFNEQKEFKQIEKELEKLETKKEELSQKMNTTMSHDELMKYSKEIEEIIVQIENKTNRWLELSEFM